VGEALAPLRDRAVIATTFGFYIALETEASHGFCRRMTLSSLVSRPSALFREAQATAQSRAAAPCGCDGLLRCARNDNRMVRLKSSCSRNGRDTGQEVYG
jgi:hypothetical protein